MTHAAMKGHNDPAMLEEAERALQKVPNCSGLNHCIKNVINYF